MNALSSEDKASMTNSSILRQLLRRPISADSLPPWSRRVGLLMFGMLQNAVAGGLIFGWASIDHTLLAAPFTSGGADLQLQQTTLIFSLATSISMVAALILGAVLDHSGPRVASILSCLTIASGSLVFAFATHFTTFVIGTILLGFGGPGIGNSIIHMANLFPGNENLVMSCLSGSIAMSFSVFAVIDNIWEQNETVSFRVLFASLAAVIFMLAVGAFLLYPDEPYEEMVEDDDDPSEVDEETMLLVSPPSIERLPLNDRATSYTGHDKEPQNEEEHGMHLYSHPKDPTFHTYHEKNRHPALSPPRASMTIEQPLNSFLRDNQKMMVQTDSYRASKKAILQGGRFVSLKDQPFYSQLSSGAYIRAFLVFLVSSFVTNFYVGTLSTALGDKHDYSLETRHDLANWFTMMMSMGIFGSLLVGWMIDQIGLEVCTAATLILGQLQMLLIFLGGQNESVMIASFFVYAVFRAFLYPVFIGSLTARLGFKYFGVLLGLGFAWSGIVTLLFPVLVEAIKGDCHLDNSDAETCDHGHWETMEVVQFFALGAMLVIPVIDHRETVAKKEQIERLLSSSSPFVEVFNEGRA